MVSIFGWTLVRSTDLSYLHGVARGAKKLQRSHSKHGQWNASMQAKNRKLREQIACDQVYIDDLETVVDPVALKEIRQRMKLLRREAALTTSRSGPPTDTPNREAESANPADVRERGKA